MNPNIQTLKESYLEIIGDFSEKHGLVLTHFSNNDDWTSYAWFGEKYNFSMQDIVRDIKNNRPPNAIKDWFIWNETSEFPNIDFHEYCELKSLQR